MNAIEKAIDEICRERKMSRDQLLKALPWLRIGLEGKKPSG